MFSITLIVQLLIQEISTLYKKGTRLFLFGLSEVPTLLILCFGTIIK